MDKKLISPQLKFFFQHKAFWVGALIVILLGLTTYTDITSQAALSTYGYLPIVEKMAPNSVPDHCLVWNQ